MRMQSLIGAIFCLLASCGDEPKLEKQGRANIRLPEYVGFGGGFDLQGQTSNRNYEGPLIIWRGDADPAKLAEMLRMSKELKAIEANFKPEKLAYDGLLARINEAKAQLSTGEDTLTKALIEPLNQHYAKEDSLARALNASRWFEERVDVDKKAQFEAFCDAQVFKMAAYLFEKEEARFDYNRKYTRRPMPLAICEGYYKSNGFFTDPSCEPSEGGKDYSECFFGETGVGKTRAQLYKEVRKARGRMKRLVYEGPVSDEEARLFLQRLKDPEVRQGLGRSFFFNRALLSLGDLTYQVKFGDDRFSEVIDILPSQLMLESCGEDNKLAADEMARIIEGTEDHNLTLNDRLFNLHVMLPKVDDEPLHLSLKTTQDLRKLEADFPDLYSAPAGSEVYKRLDDFLDAPAQLNTLLEKRKSLLFGSKMEQTKIDWWKYKFKSRDYAVDNRLTVMILPLVQLTMQYADDAVLASLRLDHGKGENTETKVLMQGCYDMVKATSVACSDLASDKLHPHPDSLPLDLSLDASTGKLTLAFTIFDPKRQGLSRNLVPTEKDLRFQEMAPEQLFGKKMRFELYPRTYTLEAEQALLQDLEPSVRLVSGKVFIDDTEPPLEGSLSLSEAGDLKTLYSVDPEIKDLCAGKK